MKKQLFFCLLTIIIFGTVTISTAKLETAFDGNDAYGFPLTFFIRLGGKRFPNPANWYEIFYFNLFIDIIVAFLLSLIIWNVYMKLIKAMQEK